MGCTDPRSTIKLGLQVVLVMAPVTGQSGAVAAAAGIAALNEVPPVVEAVQRVVKSPSIAFEIGKELFVATVAVAVALVARFVRVGRASTPVVLSTLQDGYQFIVAVPVVLFKMTGSHISPVSCCSLAFAGFLLSAPPK